MRPHGDINSQDANPYRQGLQRLLALVEGGGEIGERLAQVRAELRSILFEEQSSPSIVVNAKQLKTLELLAQGLSNRTIAKRLDLAEETVKCHVRSLLDRLNVPNRTSLALWAIREGVVPIQSRAHPVRNIDGCSGARRNLDASAVRNCA